jgi:hypothetical protein
MRFEFRRAAFIVPVIYLNFLFLFTSHAVQLIPFSLWGLYWLPLKLMDLQLGLGIQSAIDALSLFLLALTFVLVCFLTAEGGSIRRLLRAVQVSSLSLVPLGAEIFIFDNSEWNLHATQFQADHGIIPWFSNADLFVSCFALFAAVTFLEWHATKSKPHPNTFNGTVPTMVQPVGGPRTSTKPESKSLSKES